MTKASKKKSSGSKYAVLILTAVIAIIAIGCGLFMPPATARRMFWTRRVTSRRR